MAEAKKQTAQQTEPPAKNVTVANKASDSSIFFSKENYKWMVIGGIIIILGMVLMMGGKSSNPEVFDYNVVYSTTRITIAPILIVGGLLVELYAILRKPKQNTNA